MGWLFMLVNALAMGLFFGVEPKLGFYLALLLLAISFATFCLLYDQPVNRARQRIATQLGALSGKGIHAEEFQRLQSMKVNSTAEDRKFRLTLLSGVNLGAGIAGAAMLVWALVARFA